MRSTAIVDGAGAIRTLSGRNKVRQKYRDTNRGEMSCTCNLPIHLHLECNGTSG